MELPTPEKLLQGFEVGSLTELDQLLQDIKVENLFTLEERENIELGSVAKLEKLQDIELGSVAKLETLLQDRKLGSVAKLEKLLQYRKQETFTNLKNSTKISRLGVLDILKLQNVEIENLLREVEDLIRRKAKIPLSESTCCIPKSTTSSGSIGTVILNVEPANKIRLKRDVLSFEVREQVEQRKILDASTAKGEHPLRCNRRDNALLRQCPNAT